MSLLDQRVKRTENDESSSGIHWTPSPAHIVLIFLAILFVAAVVALRPWIPTILGLVKDYVCTRVNQLLDGVSSLGRERNGEDQGRRGDIELQATRNSPVLRTQVAGPPPSVTVPNAQLPLPFNLVNLISSAGTELLESTAAPSWASGASPPTIGVPPPVLHSLPPVHLVQDGRERVQRIHRMRPVFSRLF